MTRLVPFACVAWLALTACQPEPLAVPKPGALAQSGETVATVGEEKITSDMIDAVLRRAPPDKRDQILNDPKRKQELVDKLVLSSILYKEALDRKIEEDPKVQMAVAMTAREVLAGEVLDQIGSAAVTDDTVKAKYDSMAMTFNKPQTHLLHILVKEEALAKEVKGRLDKGEDFTALAKQYSVDRQVQKNNGDLGWVARPPFKEAQEPLEKATPGSLVGPVMSKLGYSLFKVVERRDATPLEEVRPQIEQMVKMEAMKNYQADAKRTAKVEYVGGVPAGGEGAGTDGEVTPPLDGPHTEAHPVPPSVVH